jgi:hypothetical protein
MSDEEIEDWIDGNYSGGSDIVDVLSQLGRDLKRMSETGPTKRIRNSAKKLYTVGDTRIFGEDIQEEGYRRIIDWFLRNTKKFIVSMEPKKDLANLLETETEPLSQLPDDIVRNIGSYVSGEEGSLGAQMSKLRVKSNLSGVSSRNGGRKTRRSKKTRRRK